ncbi:unnamed protein product [Arabidopsis thaliana]|uniref:(thale cress) hypothetical protein n=1 Tax=Arabidopsis thaliana TaxID=3702 RepID=A0A7G2E9C5_ARATH|nr:unnamed protein product [Arabidopsis thaliana]
MEHPHVLLVASPGLGHLIPALELGNRLSFVLNVHVTILAITSGSSSLTETETIHTAAARGTCEIIELPSVDIDHLVEPDATVVTKIVSKMREMKSTVRDAVKSMKQKPTVMIVDFFGTALLSITDVGVTSKYVYIPSHAWFLALIVYLPVLDKVMEGEYVDIKEPMKIPGCKPVGPKELLDTMLDRSDQQYRDCVQIGLEIPMSDGVLVNTWGELQGKTLAALREDIDLNRVIKVPVYPIGPIVRTNEIGMAIRTSELPSKKVISREEVASLVKKIVAEEDKEGRKIKTKAEEVRVSSERAWTHGGSSHSSLFEWAKRCGLVS